MTGRVRPGEVSVWPPLPLDVYRRARTTRLPFPLDQPACSVFAKGRHGLWHGVQSIGLQPGDKVLVPAYHHGSEIEALMQAGLDLRFYDTGNDLAPDPEVLDALLAPGVRALHLCHYLGFPQSAQWRSWCDQRGLLLIDDAAQAWLSTQNARPTGALGDLAIFCLYKTYGLPDGAAVVSQGTLAGPSGRHRPGMRNLARRHGAWVAQRSGTITQLRAARPSRGIRRRTPEELALGEIALGDPHESPSRMTIRLLPRIMADDTAARRRANYRTLLDALGDLVPPGFARLPDGAAPFAFPVQVADKAGFRASLARAGIHALDFWRDPHPTLRVDEFPIALRLRGEIVALPVHQELRPGEVERMRDVALRIVAGGAHHTRVDGS